MPRYLQYDAVITPSGEEFGKIVAINTDGTVDIDVAVPNDNLGNAIRLSNVQVSNDYVPKIGDWVHIIMYDGYPIVDRSVPNVTIDINGQKTVIVNPGQITDGVITTPHIEDGAIDNDKIADGAIDNDKIADGAIDGSKIADGSIDSVHIKNGVIDSVHIKYASIDTAHIKDAAITNAKIANAAIDSAKIKDASITSAHIIDGSITNAKIANAAIDSAKIANASITSAHIQSGAIGSAHIQDGVINTVHIADGSITDAKIVSVTANKITAGTIDTGQVTVQGPNGKLRITSNRLQVFDNQPIPKERVSIGDVNGDGTVYGIRVRGPDGTTILYDHNGVYSEGITDGAITNPKIADGAVDTRVIAANAVTADKIVAGAVTTEKLATNAVTASKIAANTITAGSAIIADGAITTAKIADGAITNAKIANATITGAKIANATITDAHISNLSANKITTGTLDASKVSVINLSANSITTGTLTGITIQTAASGDRIVLSGNTLVSYASSTKNGPAFEKGTWTYDINFYQGGYKIGAISNNYWLMSIQTFSTPSGSTPLHISSTGDIGISAGSYVSIDGTSCLINTASDLGVSIIAGSTAFTFSGANYVWGGSRRPGHPVIWGGGPGSTRPALKFATTNDLHVRTGDDLNYAKVSASQFAQASSAELKRNISDCSFCAVDVIKRARVRTFSYTHEPDVQRVGFIAEEAPLEFKNNDPNAETISLGDVLAITVKAVQELTQRVEAIESKLNRTPTQ